MVRWAAVMGEMMCECSRQARCAHLDRPARRHESGGNEAARDDDEQRQRTDVATQPRHPQAAQGDHAASVQHPKPAGNEPGCIFTG
jgi:hypothetical protein